MVSHAGYVGHLNIILAVSHMPHIWMQAVLLWPLAKNHSEVQFELSYDKGLKLLVCVAVTLDKEVSEKPKYERGSESDKEALTP
jgi:hypothetical protein